MLIETIESTLVIAREILEEERDKGNKGLAMKIEREIQDLELQLIILEKS